jgi:hypothetical protein
MMNDELHPNGGWPWMRKSAHFSFKTGMPIGGNVVAIDGSGRWRNVPDPIQWQSEWNITWQMVMTPKGTSRPHRNSSYYFATTGEWPSGAKRGYYIAP